MKRIIRLFQRHLLDLAEPVHQERHAGPEVVPVEQCVDHQRECFRRAEAFQMLLPETEIGSRFAALMPAGQCVGNMQGRVRRLAAVDPANIAHLGAGKPVPPAGELPHLRAELGHERLLSHTGRRAHHRGVQIENALHDSQQIVDARIGGAVFTDVEEREQALEAKNVPRINDGPAVDAVLKQVFNFRQEPGRFHQLAAFRVLLAGRQADAHLAEHPHRGDRDARGLTPAGFRIAHFGHDPGELPLLQLQRSLSGQVLIEMLAGAAEWLSSDQGFFS